MLTRLRKSLSFKISALLIVMVLLCAVSVGVSGYILYKDDNIASNANRALAVAEATAAAIQPEEFARIMESGEKDDYWYSAKDILDGTKVRTNVKYLYVVGANYTDTMTYFAEGYDPVTDPEAEMDLWDEEDVLIDGVPTYADEMFATLSTGASSVTDVYESGDWGFMVSGFAAIKNAQGQTIGVVGADISVNEVIAASNAFALRIVLIIAVFCILAGIVSVLFINTHVGRPIGVLTQGSDKLAQGDVDVQIDIYRQDEIGLLADSFRRMTEHTLEQAEVLRHIADGDLAVQVDARSEKDVMAGAISQTIAQLSALLQDIQNSSRQVANGSEQIAMGAQHLASASTQQAATLENFSASIDDVQAQSQANTQQATSTLEETMHADTLMQQSMETMIQLSQSMQEIIESSQGIAKIIKVVDDIAFQTNILALNAAVEAARAGEHGKGFAVVADEVRSLASKSGEAARETAVMIEDNVQKVGTGSHLADETKQMLEKVHGIVAANAAAMEHINQSSSQQYQSIQSITRETGQLSDVIQKNSATAQQSAAAAEEMASQAQMLLAIVARFKLQSGADGQH